MMYRTVSTTVANNSMAPGSIVGSESAIVDIVTQLGATFTKLIELMLSKEIKVNSTSNFIVLSFEILNLGFIDLSNIVYFSFVVERRAS